MITSYLSPYKVDDLFDFQQATNETQRSGPVLCNDVMTVICICVMNKCNAIKLI